MYKDCYLRFCTREFNLNTTQQNVHLCNYSIQKNYKNDYERSDELPRENMWTNKEFIDKYLKKMNLCEAWDQIIYPGMKNAIICSMMSTQDIIESRRNTFELYGADFMISQDLKPWLIEINCSPTMARTTAVTAFLCDSVLEDVCKVIIDRKTNKNCDTGSFELIYKATAVPQPNYTGIDLKIDGQACKKSHYAYSGSSLCPLNNTNNSSNNSNINSNNVSQLTSFESLKLTRQVSTEEPTPLSIIELKSCRNSNTKQKLKNYNYTSNSFRLRKETTLPTISIVDSIHGITNKEKQNISHLSNYKSNLIFNDSNDSKTKDMHQNDFSNTNIIRRKANEERYSLLKPLNITNKCIQFQQNGTNNVKTFPFSDIIHYQSSQNNSNKGKFSKKYCLKVCNNILSKSFTKLTLKASFQTD